MTESQGENTSSTLTEVTNTPTQEVIVSTKVVKPKGKPLTVTPVVPIVESVESVKSIEESLVINVGPLKDITKDTHTRMVQYLGIVNPGVLRIMAEMLAEQEAKVINFLVSAGIKFG